MPDDHVPNPLLLQWVKEWLDQATERSTKGVTTYKNAYNSLKVCPLTFHHPSELKKLKGFGDKLCERLTDKMNKHCQQNGLPIPKRSRNNARSLDEALALEEINPPLRPKRQRKPKPYVPKLRSGPYALLLALGDMDEDGRSGLSKSEVIEAAQPHCDASFTVPPSANGHYTAWNSMAKLLEKELVVERGRPIRRYLLTDEGWDVAKNLKAVVEGRQASVSESRRSESVKMSPPRKAQPRNANQTKPSGLKFDGFVEFVGGGDSDSDIVEVDARDFDKRTARPTSPKQPSFAQMGERDNAKQDTRSLNYIDDIVPNKFTLSKPTESRKDGGVSPIRIPPGAFTFHLVLDSREVRAKRDRDYMQNELEKKGISPITRPLPLGDFTWVAKLNKPNLLRMNGDEGNEVVLDWIVERKRLDDLISSIKDSRFREQKFRLGRSGIKNVVYLVEEMNIDSEVWHKNEEAVQTALASTQVVDGFFVKKTQTTDDTIRYIARMTDMLRKNYETQPLYVIPGNSITPQSFLPTITGLREKEPSKGFYISYNSFESLGSKSDNLTLRDVYLKMLMCTRGVTGEKALEIQAKWKTPREFVEAFEKCGSGEVGRKRKRELIYGEMSHMVGKRKMGRALSGQIAEVWADGV
ncbi:hypothetical protein MKZ38_002812 [Zalerion maritima]|uniref:Crossover junction endonuclease MUS81 n=1 Tax=Zalerion maritima TaxID=339359 RepID=A0AAD5RND4_9PEZI|nr:hypothetical protein MKZ38_002812 [Zalerion maritima]